jgi:hypothetical protein
MSSLLHWQSAQARTSELRRLDAATDKHPFARFLFLRFRPEKRSR